MGRMTTAPSPLGHRYRVARGVARGLLLAGVLATVACASTPGTTRTLTVPGATGDRTATVYRASDAGAGAPLVVVLHGAGGTAAEVRRDLGWDGLADREGLVVAYPDGLDRTWNAGGCCGGARERGVDDVGFLDALVAAVRRDDGTGPVYAVGFSNGAMMSYAWACARPRALAGIGPVGGARVVDCPAPAPLSVVAVHGRLDAVVPLDGGRGPSETRFPSFDGSLAPFRAAAGCPPAAAGVDDRTCGRVVGAVVDDVPHVWPGAGPAAGTSDEPADATGFLWARLAGSGS